LYPSQFEYHAPTSVAEAVEILGRYDGEARVLAGGQSLIPLLKLRFTTLHAVVDINRIPGLDTLAVEDGALRIGALVRHRDCERSPLLKEARWRVLGEAAPQIADPVVRNLGTVCGSVAHADPQGDWGSVMLATGAEVVTASAAGGRTIPIADFFQGPFTTALEPGEMITEIRLPDPGGRASGAYLKLERKVGDFATAAVAVHLAMSDGSVASAGIALTGVGAQNIKASAAESAIAGREPTPDAIAEAARLAAEAADPHDDLRGTAEYKRNVVRVFCQRGLQAAAAAAAA
jgi:carbon-monoxide dehydrogenase medium subunit